ncbi:hypothetical protein HNR74_005026 [Flammeovirga kamogawensis]|nr:hypothetical protein [Flammeovirga kamogawensis]
MSQYENTDLFFALFFNMSLDVVFISNGKCIIIHQLYTIALYKLVLIHI